ncbi:MAG: ATP-dependent zinc metalloprotease FTSH chloroplastic-like [Trebouxia sp. A1-2]|nr:MAG: ATP-dependent zinc metalloprotease FTSH chloroplastic-like [Trebouxia sp. A1-2]
MRSCWGCSTFYGVDLQPAAAHRLTAARAPHVICANYYLCARLPGSRRGSTFLESFSHSRSPSVLLAAQSRTRVQRLQVQTLCSSNDRQSSNSRRPRRGWPPWKWPEEIPSLSRIAFNVTAFLLLMRIWPLHGRSPLGQAQPVAVQVPFSEFIQQTDSDHVSAVTVDNRSVKYTLRPDASAFRNIPQKDEAVNVAFQTTRPADYAMPYGTLVKQGVQFAAVDSRNSPILTVMVYAMYIGLLLSALNKLPLKLPGNSAGRRHVQKSSTSEPVTFDDVAGVDEAKEELAEVVELLRSPEKFSKLGARAPSGVLLVGPPGTGKTLLAKAVAGEADVPFFSISASEFVELYVGMGAMRVRQLFAQARKEAPAIVFIDEIDAVAKGRDTRLRGVGNDEREQTLNQLLTELDGFDSKQDKMVICIAATNRADVLDPALLRPGRFDRRVAVERPDRIGRQEILQTHIQKQGLPLGADVTVDSIAASTTGFTGADLANLINEAALLAGRSDKGEVGQTDFDQAILRAVAGVEKKRSVLQGAEKESVAKHECGHALVSTAVATLIPTSPQVEKLSIIPRSGGALGFTYTPPKTEDRALMFDNEIRGQLAMLMGGRAAEELTCGHLSTGASDDIRRATELAYRAVSEFGLSSVVGPLAVSSMGGGDDGALMLRDSGGMISRQVERDVQDLVQQALSVAKSVVKANMTLHGAMSRKLESTERLDGRSLQDWLSSVTVPEDLRDFVQKGQNRVKKGTGAGIL